MGESKNGGCHGDRVDNSQVTPATGTDPNNKPIADSLANTMPYADTPAANGSVRADPDKIIPGNESPTGVDGQEEMRTIRDEER